jgi:hypothetical protein
MTPPKKMKEKEKKILGLSFSFLSFLPLLFLVDIINAFYVQRTYDKTY